MKLNNKVYSFKRDTEETKAAAKAKPALNTILKTLTGGPKPPPSNIGIAYVFLTPPKMKALLEHTRKFGDIIQRRVYDKHATDYEELVLAEQWHEVGTVLFLDWAGCVMDGSHRIEAFSELEISIPVWIMYGFNPEEFQYIDTGMQRTIANLFEMIGVLQRSGVIGSVTGGVVKYDTEFMPYGFGKHKAIPFPPRRKVYENLKVICEEAANVYWQSKKVPGMTPRAAGTGFVLIAREVGQERARKFFGRFIAGTGLKKTDPELVLRQKVALEVDYGGDTLFLHHLAYLIKAFNLSYWKEKATEKDISWEQSDDQKGEPFPQVNVRQ